MAETQQAPHIDTVQVPYFADIINRYIVDNWGFLDGMSGRAGAYYGCADSYGTPYSVTRIGSVPEHEKRAKYDRIVRMKLGILAIVLPASDSDKLTTRSVADPRAEWYPGGIAGIEMLWAVSGYTGNVDELAALALAYAMEDISRVDAERLATMNPLGTKLGELLDLVNEN